MPRVDDARRLEELKTAIAVLVCERPGISLKDLVSELRRSHGFILRALDQELADEWSRVYSTHADRRLVLYPRSNANRGPTEIRKS